MACNTVGSRDLASMGGEMKAFVKPVSSQIDRCQDEISYYLSRMHRKPIADRKLLRSILTADGHTCPRANI